VNLCAMGRRRSFGLRHVRFPQMTLLGVTVGSWPHVQNAGSLPSTSLRVGMTPWGRGEALPSPGFMSLLRKISGVHPGCVGWFARRRRFGRCGAPPDHLVEAVRALATVLARGNRRYWSPETALRGRLAWHAPPWRCPFCRGTWEGHCCAKCCQ
jgi:hypothetical protein